MSPSFGHQSKDDKSESLKRSCQSDTVIAYTNTQRACLCKTTTANINSFAEHASPTPRPKSFSRRQSIVYLNWREIFLRSPKKGWSSVGVCVCWPTMLDSTWDNNRTDRWRGSITARQESQQRGEAVACFFGPPISEPLALLCCWRRRWNKKRFQPWKKIDTSAADRDFSYIKRSGRKFASAGKQWSVHQPTELARLPTLNSWCAE